MAAITFVSSGGVDKSFGQSCRGGTCQQERKWDKKHQLVTCRRLFERPIGSPQAADEKRLFGRLKKRCCRECGCVLWVFGVVLRDMKEVFLQSRAEVVDDGDED
ncbi:hypothetical protein V6N12_036485 [Hibiscus sabdariffa]|uniref:Uncharacterized protein n=1 Tax=Hibiscus sabdariffa TaxID=183260 RepID=A0ABR2EQT2_9ROSI